MVEIALQTSFIYIKIRREKQANDEDNISLQRYYFFTTYA